VFTQILSRPAPGQNRQQRPQRNGQHHSKPGNRKPQPVKHGAAREKKSTGRREY